jgi:hypothetical protein
LPWRIAEGALMLSRVVSPEVLDDLPQDDPQAIGSRRDLKRVHCAMGTRAILLHALQDMPALRRTAEPLRILELGAGDGSLMLGVARAIAPIWAPVHLTLLDAQPLITQGTISSYAELGWTTVACVRDVFEWADRPTAEDRHGDPVAPWDLIVANLFLHHFEAPQLVRLLRSVADRCDRFLACEPRRTWLSLTGSHLIGALGTNAVTREDAVISVHAGFRGQELTALWPDVGDKWEVQEYAAGLFSHCFRAEPIATE